jgi:hypothetical protein
MRRKKDYQMAMMLLYQIKSGGTVSRILTRFDKLESRPARLIVSPLGANTLGELKKNTRVVRVVICAKTVLISILNQMKKKDTQILFKTENIFCAFSLFTSYQIGYRTCQKKQRLLTKRLAYNDLISNGSNN